MRENINPKERFSEEGHRLSTFILNLILHVDGHSSLDLELLFLIFSGIIELISGPNAEDNMISIVIQDINPEIIPKKSQRKRKLGKESAAAAVQMSSRDEGPKEKPLIKSCEDSGITLKRKPRASVKAQARTTVRMTKRPWKMSLFVL